MSVRIKRVYEPPSRADGYRVLIDRLWPRGVSKEKASIDEWARDLAPSDELRRWFGHRPELFEEFKRRYTEELREQADLISALRRRARTGTVTMLPGRGFGIWSGRKKCSFTVSSLPLGCVTKA